MGPFAAGTPNITTVTSVSLPGSGALTLNSIFYGMIK